MPLDRTLCYRALQTRDARFDGRFFTAVRTTGIYCRPICPARPPKLENVEFYPTAASAQEAGFRPCLRCRPEVSPRFAAWRGTWNSVARALLLIDQGALDTGDVEHLATRLGMTGRHLRRLFDKHLGAPPIAVAQTRRLQLAKQLLDETALPVAHIAYASGFGSVRRFNDAMHHTYDRPPTDIRRATKRRQPSVVASADVTLKLPFAPPYNWDVLIAFLAARAIPGVEHVTPTAYRRSIQHDGVPGMIDVHYVPDQSHLTVTIRFPTIAVLGAIVDRIRHVFDVGADVEMIATTLAADPHLALIIQQQPGVRIPGAWDGFELAVRAILGQQVSVRAATALAGKLVAHYGIPLQTIDNAPADDAITHIFPSPRIIAGIAGDALAQTLGMPRARAAAIITLAAAVTADPTLLLPGSSLDESIAHLCALPGIGEWTAHYIAMRALREPDAFPAADLVLRRVMTTNGVAPTTAQLIRHAEQWRPWRAYAAMYLWTMATLQHSSSTTTSVERIQ